jgi:hypothetical protein
VWSDPERRVRKYRIGIGYHFHFDPRQVDEWTVEEFDGFASACDAIDKENDKARRDAESSSRRR